MNRQPRAGLLPLYIKLYDDCMPEKRKEFDPFLAKVTGKLAAAGVDVVCADICRVAGEFDRAIARFESEGVDLIISLHLAYSPSLESIDALTRTELPLVILDTTMDFGFGLDVHPDRIMYNHGVHGVMDMASVLRRRGRGFQIVAGHIDESRVIDRAAHMAQAALAAGCLKKTKALRIGESFAGMGDFAVEESILRDVLGITVQQATLADLAAHVEKVSLLEIEEEVALDRERYALDLPEEVHARSVRVGLGLRRMLGEGGFDAFSINFLAFDRGDGPVDTVPFLEISKAMSRGIGYGGEGDVLTAALVGAMARGFGRTTFTEIFCPDWEGETLFLSHMGELNPEIAAEKPDLIERPFPFTPAQNPAVLTCAPHRGDAVFVNIAPGPDDSFGLIVAPCEVMHDTENDEMKKAVRAWIRPDRPLSEFLETYSRWGGTHHSALIMGDKSEAVQAFAAMAGLECFMT